MLRAAAIFPARFAAAPAVAAAEELRSPLLRVLGALRGGGGGGRSMLLGRRARFCSNSSASDSEAAAVEAKAEDAAVAEGEADGKASSAIVPTTPRPEDFLTVCHPLSSTRISCVVCSFAYSGCSQCRGLFLSVGRCD
jgi:ATP-dependent Lon protease